ncbi:glutamate receptor ionotropic, kainate 2-like [Artemia franciscana]|uniref:glutamate receptor ionotropic, kainate 2-like n=1 Tax=Artemia franciscana TaxID=6661 RepID=UPI0032DAD089
MKEKYYVFVLSLFNCLFCNVFGLPDVIRIGGLFDSGDARDEAAFKYAVERVNGQRNVLPKNRLAVQFERLPWGDSFFASERVCQLLRVGVAGIFGPQSSETSGHIQSVCDALEVPHLEMRWRTNQNRDAFALNLYPAPDTFAKAYAALLKAKEWKSMAILYDDVEGLTKLHLLLKGRSFSDTKFVIYQLVEDNNFRPLLRQIQRGGEKNILIDCSVERLEILLKQVQQIGMMTSEYSYVLTTLDLHTINLEDYQYGGTNITALRLVDPTKPESASLVSDWVQSEQRYGRRINNSDMTITTRMAMIYDGVVLFAKALHELDRSQDVNIRPLSCDSADTSTFGNSLANYMRLVEMEGLTGVIKFDTRGVRSYTVFDIVELTEDGLNKVGNWEPYLGINLTRRFIPLEEVKSEGLRNKTMIVTTILSPPYAMLKESPEQLIGNDRFEGMAIDVIDEVSKLLGFNYTYRIVEDNAWGNRNKETGQWNGMIKEILDGATDMAIGDLSINFEREEAVDFTMPWMNTGISILYKKPQKAPPSLFSFMSPFSLSVWIWMSIAYVGVSVVLYMIARLSPYEWYNPYPCIEDPDVLENQFNLLNSMWFTLGSLMQQGSDIAPKAVSTRMVGGIWWFFTLIMISSYTANLAAFLTVERMVSPINSAEDLVKQTKIKYGGVLTGSTVAFFRDSKIPTYKKMYESMSAAKPSAFVNSNPEGVERVQNSNGLYAFLMESSSIEFQIERKCDLTQIGGQLDFKGYGIALKPGSPYRSIMNEAILKLQETNRLLILKNRWWKEKRGGGRCKDEASGSGAASELALANVGGVFLVLVCGMSVGAIVAVLESLFKIWRNCSNDKTIDFKQELKEEMKFVLKCAGNTKPVRRRMNDTDSKKYYRASSSTIDRI